ncbi:MAG: glycerol-3-phosphate 1-O-acyltransferase PlsY [Coriobacteriales bacterium]|jgi:glycerol-3-phosphate acyltransferase PlsY|nr:glycerol-3-phosphate 1-O-acyltransferase PlsY [Coriobacteriales bacterium]
MILYLVTLVIALAIAYLCGSIPVALIVGRATAGVDIRQHGSGNTGTTNALRTLGWKAGLVVFVLDVLKGVAGGLVMIVTLALIGNQVPVEAQSGVGVDLPRALASVAAILGHMFSPFMGFKGGKGVATMLGALLVLLPFSALCALVLFGLVLLISRIVSVASIVAVISVPFFTLLFYGHSLTYVIFTFVLAFVVVLAHKKNIIRLAQGQEPRIALGRKADKKGSNS